MPIKILDPKVVSQIAAGEVVERPASVVKELVENALDAGSTQISIEVRGGGTSMIRVIDNGIGIPTDEVEVAFKRHATSKLERLKDLDKIESLGFRGEALPSITAVAQVEVITCTAGETTGTLIELDNGEVTGKENRSRSQGTTITVSNLFQKIPARLKFLKSHATENGHIANIVSQYALAFPEVRFTLIVDGKQTVRTPGSGKLIDSVIELYGLETAQHMLEVGTDATEWERDDSIRVTGMVGSPSVSRSNRNYLSFFVNRRWINSRMLAWAVEEAYHGLLMTGKHPTAIINITLPADRLDVNIHPTKTEVKFQDERAIFGAVQKAVRQALIASAPVPRMEEPTAVYAESRPVIKSLWESSHAPEKTKHSMMARPQTPLVSLPMLRVLGQLASDYIIAEGPEGLYLIDQHAAHERILYEKIEQQRGLQGVEVQGLIEPVSYEVSPRQDSLLKTCYADLAEFGFSLEPFGNRTYLVRAVPALLNNKDWKGILTELLDSLTEGKREDWREVMNISLACHGAVRAGQVLSGEEMRELLQQLSKTALPNTCPHGRPTIINISLEQLARDFKRT